MKKKFQTYILVDHEVEKVFLVVHTSAEWILILLALNFVGKKEEHYYEAVH